MQATSGAGEREKTATQTITVTVTDLSGEAPGKPAAPDVAAASVTSLTVSWSAPSNAGPAITDYDVQYRAGTSGSWTDGTHTGTATTATLTGLSENTSYQVQVRATNDEGTGDWSDAGSGTTDANAAPAFSSDATFDAAENQTTAGTVAAADSDAEDDITGYAITGGADQALFEIGATTGELTFKTAPNFEDAQDTDTDNDYVVEVQATSGAGEREKTATQTITVTVTDLSGEAPGKPAAPTVAAASVTSLTVSWSAPSNAGPAITDYDVQYRAGTSGSWTDGTHTGTATTATLTGLSENTSYQVQVRATNDEGTGDWSDAGSGTTDANAAPAFSSDATFDAAENQTTAGTVAAADSDAEDDITGYAITGGADQALFEIGATTGELTFKTAPNFEDAQDTDTDNDYVVEVQATSGAGEREKTATQTITVTVTDLSGEAPGKPAAPDVAAASVTSLTVSWSAPSNAGPAITDYDVQYRAGTSGSWTDGTHTGTATTATLTGLSENTSYQVQVRATNDEGTGDWSDAGSGTTDANAAPAFSSDATFDAAENQTTAGTVAAADSDAEDDITGYAITGGADQALFEIGATTGELTFKTAPNFEDAQDTDTDNDYVVEVQATSGAGEREKTATQTITVTVTDLSGEAPGKPAAPTVAAASVTSLTVSWSAPSNAGPAITDYDVQYRAGTSGSWTDGTHTGTATTATLTGLSENTSYQVQVRATNDEGTGDWSDAGSGTTDANAAPAFSSDATFDAAENQTTAGTVAAADSDAEDDITGYAITGGADQALFEIGATTGELTFKTAPNFEDAQDTDTDNDYVVEVQATSGAGEREKTATQTITVTVTDLSGEAPGKPAAPDVAAASVTSLTVSWSAPSNAGPAITDYDVQYRAGTSGSWTDGTHTGTATTATLTGLSENTSYQVQVRATNDEGTGDWSDAGSGTTEDDDLPTVGFSEESVFIVEEGGEIEFDVELSASSTVPITVDWETKADSAEADVDYTEASGTLTFAPDDTEETIRVAIIDDEILEGLDVFTVRLSGTDDALVTLGTSSSTGRIIDRDEATITFAEETTVDEDAGTVTLTLTASAPSTAAYTIDYDTEDGTAEAGTDYTAASGTVRFPALATERTIAITVLEDTVDEEPEHFTVKLDDPSNRRVYLASGPPPRVLIVDKIAPPPEALEAEPVAGSYTSLAVSWEAPPDTDGAPPLTGYEVRYRERPDGDWVEAPHAGTARTATLTGLEVNTVYEVEVRALYGEVQSVWVRVPGEVRTATPPPARIHNVRVVGGPGSDDGVWRTEERVVVEVRYDEPVVVERPDCWTYNADGTCRPSGPYMVVAFRSDARPGYGEVQGVAQARYVRGSGTATLRFAYTVSAAEDGARGAWAADGGLLLRGATIRTLEGGEGKSRYTNTRVMQVTVDRSGRAWTAGEKVRVKVRFSGPVPYTPPDEPENRDKVVVDETEGTPTIDLLLGDREDREQTRRASYERGSGTNTLVFEYEVTAGDGRVGAVEVVADTLASNGATIRNRRGYDAELGHLGAVQYAPRSLTTGKPTNRVTVSVADTRVRESPGATLDFAVTLSGSASDPVTVDYRTVDGSARAGSDYTAASSTLTFAPGETAKTVSVPVLDDAHDEGEEKMGLVLYRASGAVRDDYVAIGTIENSDPLQQAWLARFGRTVATHVTDAVGARLRGTPGQESHLTVGGSRLPVETLFGGADATAPVAAEPEVFSLRQWLRGAGPGPGPAAGERAPAWLQGVAGVLGLGAGPADGSLDGAPWRQLGPAPGAEPDPRSHSAPGPAGEFVPADPRRGMMPRRPGHA